MVLDEWLNEVVVPLYYANSDSGLQVVLALLDTARLSHANAALAHSIAAYALKEKNFERALVHFHQAANHGSKSSRKSTSTFIVNVYHQMAILYERSTNYDIALILYELMLDDPKKNRYE